LRQQFTDAIDKQFSISLHQNRNARGQALSVSGSEGEVDRHLEPAAVVAGEEALLTGR
jgi:hypothetical protein